MMGPNQAARSSRSACGKIDNCPQIVDGLDRAAVRLPIPHSSTTSRPPIVLIQLAESRQ